MTLMFHQNEIEKQTKHQCHVHKVTKQKIKKNTYLIINIFHCSKPLKPKQKQINLRIYSGFLKTTLILKVTCN